MAVVAGWGSSVVTTHDRLLAVEVFPMKSLPIPFRQVGLVVLVLGIFVPAGWAQTAPPIPPPPPPTLFVDADKDITLSVVAAGSTPLSYQWLRDFSPIAGATSASLTISRAQVFTDWGNYCVVLD